MFRIENNFKDLITKLILEYELVFNLNDKIFIQYDENLNQNY